MTDLKPRTRYHCPVGVASDGYGHSSLYTGDYSSPRDGDGVCICGAQMVETIADGLHVLTWEMIGPYDDDWRPARREHRVRLPPEDDDPIEPGRWRPGVVRAVRYEVTSHIPGEWFTLDPADVRSAPRLPL